MNGDQAVRSCAVVSSTRYGGNWEAPAENAQLMLFITATIESKRNMRIGEAKLSRIAGLINNILQAAWPLLALLGQVDRIGFPFG